MSQDSLGARPDATGVGNKFWKMLPRVTCKENTETRQDEA